MNKLVLDPAVRSQLNGLNGEVELCDEEGRTVGFFVPANLRERLWYDWAKAQFTDDELERARRQPGGRTTAEVLERLRKL
jgi:hypothetical protein